MNKRTVGWDVIGDYRVSTVRLLIPMGPGQDYETMVFPNDDFGDLACERYATEADARAGHARWVDQLKTGEWTPE